MSYVKLLFTTPLYLLAISLWIFSVTFFIAELSHAATCRAPTGAIYEASSCPDGHQEIPESPRPTEDEDSPRPTEDEDSPRPTEDRCPDGDDCDDDSDDDPEDNIVLQPGPGGPSIFSPTRLNDPTPIRSIRGFILAIAEVLLILAVPVVAFFLIYGGFLYVTARGSEDQIKKAHSTITWAIVGGLVIFGAFAIVQVIEAVVESFR